MDTLTERLERLAELQKKNVEPLQHLGGSAFAAFERMARKNYELMGDMVEYAVAQSRGSLEQDSPQSLYEHQMTEARAFAERMGERAAEYMALAEQMRSEMTPDGIDHAVDAEASPSTDPSAASAKKAPVRKASAKKTAASSKKTASKKRAAKKTTAKKATARKSASGKKTGSRKTAARKTASK